MIHLRRAGSALAAATLTLILPLSGGAAVAGDAQRAALKPQIDTSWIQLADISPATIPAKGTVVVRGSVHNGSGQTWHHLAVVPQTSFDPIQTSSELDAAAGYDPANVTLRQQLPGLAESLADLAPNKTTAFVLRIPRSQMHISGGTGAYWLGVVPTSDESHPATLTARTFLPLLPKVNARARVNIAMVVPLRSSPLRTPSGALASPAAFTALLSPQGRLGRIAAFGQAAQGRVLSWLVDPALLDLAQDSANGTPRYTIGPAGTSIAVPTPLPTATSTPTGSTTSGASPTPSSSPTGSGTISPSGSGTPTPDQSARLTANSWLTSVSALLQSPGATTYALPYADPSVAAVIAAGYPGLLSTAKQLSSASLTARNVGGQAAVAPASGQLTQREWSAMAAGETVFISPGSAPRTPSVVAEGRTLIVASPASTGAPGPASPTSAFNLRQRLLAEASTTIGTATTTDLTVVLPSQWDPGSAAGVRTFFTQLDRPWIRFTDPSTLSGGTVHLSKNAPKATNAQRANVRAALQLRTTASRLASVLAAPAANSLALTRRIDATALSTVSYDALASPTRYRGNAARTVASLTRLLGGIRVEGTQFVTLSGSSGVITVALHNGLNQPVRVGLRQMDQHVGSTVTVDPISPITLDPGERSTLRVHLSARRVSVQEITLTAVTIHGAPVGTPLTFTLRSSSVGAVVWAVTIAIVLVLVLLVGRRLRRRWRDRRRVR